MNKNLHIVCPKLPWPTDNSFSIDMFYKIMGLHRQGVKIHLHYLNDERDKPPVALKNFCETIHPYPHEKKDGNDIFCKKNKKILFASLSRDHYPVVLAGINNTEIIETLSASHNILVRLYTTFSNPESFLDFNDRSFLSKFNLFKNRQGVKQREEPQTANCIYAFSTPGDTSLALQEHYQQNVFYLPVSNSFSEVTARTGIGSFCLYHGDLSDPENEKAAVWLLREIFNDINMPLIIAGKNPGKRIKQWSAFYSHTCLVENPECSAMEDLIHKAHIHVLPSFTTKKPESKILHALFMGRHCITNQNAVAGTELEAACHIAANKNAFKSIILQLIHRPFEHYEIDMRKRILNEYIKEDPIKLLMDRLYA